jgi:hypothetical protein
VTIEALPIPSGGRRARCDVCVIMFDWGPFSARRDPSRIAEVVPFGTDEPETTTAEDDDRESSVVVANVVTLAQQDKVLEIGPSAVQPVQDVMCVQVLGVRTTRMRAMSVLTNQQRMVLPISHEPM